MATDALSSVSVSIDTVLCLADARRFNSGKDGTMPEIVDIHRRIGIAGQVAYRVTVDHGPDNGGQATCELVGSAYGSPGPVVMITSVQTYVTDPGRYGETFNRDWIRRFFA